MNIYYYHLVKYISPGRKRSYKLRYSLQRGPGPAASYLQGLYDFAGFESNSQLCLYFPKLFFFFQSTYTQNPIWTLQVIIEDHFKVI